MLKKTVAALLVLSLLLSVALAEDRRIALETRVTKWGQMPERFVITGQALPEGVTAADFTVTGQAAAWEDQSLHPFTCDVEAVEAVEGGWALFPARFPEKFFYVKRLEIACADHPELGFTLDDIGEITTETADAFGWAVSGGTSADGPGADPAQPVSDKEASIKTASSRARGRFRIMGKPPSG